MSSTDATFHSARDLMYALPYSEPEILLVRLGNVHKDLLSTLAEIFRKAKNPGVPPRVLVRGAFKENSNR